MTPGNYESKKERNHLINNPASTKKGRTMNPLTQFKKILSLPPHIAKAFVVLTALMVVPALLGDGTQHRDPGPPDVTVSGNFGRMFRNLSPFAPQTNAVRDAHMVLVSFGGILVEDVDLVAGAVSLIVAT